MTTDTMSPDTSPGVQNVGVKRVNNMPLYILGAIAFIFFLVMALVAIDRANTTNQELESIVPLEDGGHTKTLAENISADYTDGYIPAAEPDVPDNIVAPIE